MSARETSKIEGIVKNCHYFNSRDSDIRDPHITFSLGVDTKTFYLIGKTFPPLINGYYVEGLVIPSGLSGLNRKGLFVSRLTVYDHNGDDKKNLFNYDNNSID